MGEEEAAHAYALPRCGRPPLLRRRESATGVRHALRNYSACRRTLFGCGLPPAAPARAPGAGSDAAPGSLPSLRPSAVTSPCPSFDTVPQPAEYMCMYEAQRPAPPLPHPAEQLPAAVSPATAAEGADALLPGADGAGSTVSRRLYPPSPAVVRAWRRGGGKPAAAPRAAPLSMTELDLAHDCVRTEALSVLAKRNLEIDWLRERMVKLRGAQATMVAAQLSGQARYRHRLLGLRRLTTKMRLGRRRKWQHKAAAHLMRTAGQWLQIRFWRKLLEWLDHRRALHRKERVCSMLQQINGTKLQRRCFKLLPDFIVLKKRRRQNRRQALLMVMRIVQGHLAWRWSVLMGWRTQCRRQTALARRAVLLCRATERCCLRERWHSLREWRKHCMRHRHQDSIAMRLSDATGNPMWLCRPLGALRHDGFMKWRSWARAGVVQRRKMRRGAENAFLMQKEMGNRICRQYMRYLRVFAKQSKHLRRREDCARALEAATKRQDIEVTYFRWKDKISRKQIRFLRGVLGPLADGTKGVETHEGAMRTCVQGDESRWRAHCTRQLQRIEAPFGKTGTLGLNAAHKEVKGVEGVPIKDIVAGGPAFSAGLSAGDVVASVKNPRQTRKVRAREDLMQMTGPAGHVFEGTTIELEVRKKDDLWGPTHRMILKMGATTAGARRTKVQKLQDTVGIVFNYEATVAEIDRTFNADAAYELQHDPAQCKVRMKQAFDACDENQNGSLSLDELRAVVTTVARDFGTPEPAADRIDAALYEADVDQSGELDFDEIFLYLRELFLGVIEDCPKELPPSALASSQSMSPDAAADLKAPSATSPQPPGKHDSKLNRKGPGTTSGPVKGHRGR